MSVNRCFYLTVFIFVLCLDAVNASSDCLKTKAAFDIGSGSTKMVVAQVNTCQQLIEQVLLRESEKVGYKDALAKNPRHHLPKEILQRGVEVLLKLKVKAAKLGATDFSGVATSAFRRAKNGKRAANQLAKNSGIEIEIISQRREAILGYLAVVASKKARGVEDGGKLAVWDIGGGSMQITTQEQGSAGFLVYEGRLASVSFKRELISKILKKDPDKVESPNPIGAKGEQAISLAREHSTDDVPSSIKKLLDSGITVVGIGGVHNYSILNRVASGKDRYNRKELYFKAVESLNLTDEQIDSPYAATEVSNLLLVAGFMLGLKIEQVEVKKINMADGILVAGKTP